MFIYDKNHALHIGHSLQTSLNENWGNNFDDVMENSALYCETIYESINVH